MIKELNNFWKKYLNGCEPIAHQLKHIFKRRWVRFHALPESKRYPENELEFQEICSRHRTVLNEINGLSNELLVVLPEYTENIIPRCPAEEFGDTFTQSEFWITLDQLEECGTYWHLHVAKVYSPYDELDDVFRLVANDQVRNIMIVSLSSRSVFHPYDGGADIILQSEEARNKLKQKYQGWLSQHPEGY